MTHWFFGGGLLMVFSILVAADQGVVGIGPADTGDVWRSHIFAGFQAQEQGDYIEAENQFAAALKTAEASGPLERVDTTLNNLAELYRAQGKYADAEPLYKRALAMREQASGPHHPHVAQSLRGLAALYKSLGKYDQAEPLFKRALEIWEKALAPYHQEVATTLNALGELYFAQGKYAEAEGAYKRSVAILEKELGADHPALGTSLNNLAVLYRTQGRYAEAEALYKRQLAILEQGLGSERPEVAASLENYAALLRMMDRASDAQAMEARAEAIRTKNLPKKLPPCPEEPNRVNVRVSVDVKLDSATGLYSYAYTVASDSTSVQEVDRFAVEVIEPMSGLRAPSGWSGSRFSGRPVVGWYAIEVEDPDSVPNDASLPPSIVQIKPGALLSGFSFRSPKPPGPVKYFVTGYVPLGGSSDAADDADAELIAERLVEACPHLRRHILEQAAVGTTLGPVDAPSVPALSPAQRLPSPTE
jgi:tetratricopeptide (TPR) repeat protein